MVTFKDRLQHGWNAFVNADKGYRNYGVEYGYRQDRIRSYRGNKQTIVTSIYNRIAIDCSQVEINHSRVDENDKFLDVIDSGLNNCINIEANIDQSGRAFIQDAVQSMLDEGVVAIVPTDTNISPIQNGGGVNILSLRTGKIKSWYPQHIRVELYDERTGRHREIVLPKRTVAIIENPFYSIMNEPNSTLQRLLHKMALLDLIDEQNSSGKLDLIIQLPYSLKSLQKKLEAKRRRKEIEDQLVNSKYGIAYTDGTERITQLNRPVDNTLVAQVEKLQQELYNQLGLTESIFNGTADEATMINYQNRTIAPILSAITDEFKRKFLTKTARTQGQSITFHMDPFKLSTTTVIADVADKFTTAEILSPNEVRSIIGYKPSPDAKADELRNRHLNEQPMEDPMAMESTEEGIPPEEQFQEEELTNEDYMGLGQALIDRMMNNTT